MTHRLGLSLMLEDAFRVAVLPAFEGGAIDVIEWSFDTVWDELPAWASALLTFYGDRGALVGHGVRFSLLTAEDPQREAWLERLRGEVNQRRYQRISEHFGFMRASGFTHGPPLSLPRSDAAVALGRRHLQRLADTAGVPVGLENLAFAWSRRDALAQGAFLEELLAPVNGFLVLDLHNLWCQLQNFSLDTETLLASMPLRRVRALHLSGGSWARAAGRRVRRDTHDSPIPEPVLELLEAVLPRVPEPSDVIVERLGSTIPMGDRSVVRDLDRVAAMLGRPRG